jgi:hypothetical protein
MMRTATILLTAALATAALAGCSKQPQPVTTDQIKAIAADLSGGHRNFYQAELAYAPLGAPHFGTQQIYLVPVGDGKQFRIVDINGKIYQDYQDYLRNNTLTR